MQRNWYEHRVKELCKAKGMLVQQTTDIVDSSEHIDYIVQHKSQTFTIDIKGASKLSKKDKTYSITHRWLEIRNNNGLRGSLFGNATYLVIASPYGWLWVHRNYIAGECVMRYIENHNKTKQGDDWHSRSVVGRNSIIIAAPYKYLYKHAVRVWLDDQLIQRCYATNK